MISSAAIPADSNNCDVSIIGGADAGGNPLPLSSLTAALDDYTNAYVAANPISPTNSVIIVKRATAPAGLNQTIHLKLNGKSQIGNVLPENSIPVTVTTPTPPQATQIVAGSTSTHNTAPGSLPPDPGTAPVTLI